MGNVKKEPETDTSEIKEYYSVEELREELKTPLDVFSGVIAMQGWKKGKQLKKAEYLTAVDQFRSAAAGRR